MVISTYLNKWNKVPVAVKRFILRALAILVSWKILYLLFLLPTRLLDKPLSHSVATGAVWMLNKGTNSNAYSAKSETGNEVTVDGIKNMPLDNIYFNKQNVVSIEDGCNGLELFVLYAGFIVCMPATMRRQLIFIFGGIILVYVVNVMRCAGLTFIGVYYPQHMEFAHHYIFTFIVYTLIIALWLIFSANINPANAKAK